LQKSLSVVEKHNKQKQRKVNKVISQTQRLMFTEEEKAKQKANKELQKQINLLAKQSKLERLEMEYHEALEYIEKAKMEMAEV
jgi:hypothetical protein